MGPIRHRALPLIRHVRAAFTPEPAQDSTRVTRTHPPPAHRPTATPHRTAALTHNVATQLVNDNASRGARVGWSPRRPEDD